jgi:hypothetical protein
MTRQLNLHGTSWVRLTLVRQTGKHDLWREEIPGTMLVFMHRSAIPVFLCNQQQQNNTTQHTSNGECDAFCKQVPNDSLL